MVMIFLAVFSRCILYVRILSKATTKYFGISACCGFLPLAIKIEEDTTSSLSYPSLA